VRVDDWIATVAVRGEVSAKSRPGYSFEEGLRRRVYCRSAEDEARAEWQRIEAGFRRFFDRE
jgi:hypothetical protein